MENAFSSTAVICCVGRCPKIYPISSHDVTNTNKEICKATNNREIFAYEHKRIQSVCNKNKKAITKLQQCIPKVTQISISNK